MFPRMMYACWRPLFAVALFSGLTCSANTLTVTGSTTQRFGPLEVPGFDPTLGTLKGVHVDATYTISDTIQNASSLVQSYEYSRRFKLHLLDPRNGSTINEFSFPWWTSIGQLNGGESITLPLWDTDGFDLTGNVEYFSREGSVTFVLIGSDAEFGRSLAGSGPDVRFTDADTQTRLEATVKYSYSPPGVPEPSVVWLVASGLIAGFCAKATVRTSAQRGRTQR